jgi:glycerophosphoryl diester phosphodiesterase
MLVMAHRGANRLAPENTVRAMREALDRGADGVEVDVHRSAEGSLLVHHDATSEVGPIGKLTSHQLRERLPDVPLLSEVLDACTGVLVNVEVKDPDPRASAALVELLQARSAHTVDDVLVSAADIRVIDRVRELAPALPTGFVSRWGDPRSALLRALEHGHGAVHPKLRTLRRVDLDVLVTRAHDLGVQVTVWTVNDVAEVEQLRDAGVDGVITDDSDLYRFGVRGRRR